MLVAFYFNANRLIESADLSETANTNLKLLAIVNSAVVNAKDETGISVSTDDSNNVNSSNSDDSSKQDDKPSLEELKKLGAAKSQFRESQEDRKREESNTAASPAPKLAEFNAELQPILKLSCFQCHGPDSQEGNLRIDTLNPDLLNGKDVDKWSEIFAVVTKGEMPPPDSLALEDDNRSKLVDWLSSELQAASIVRRQAEQHSTFRRMTRYEFKYAFQDLLGLPWDFAKDLPPEANSNDGFQNSSEQLHMSVTQFETYHRLAREALRRATVHGQQPPVLHWGLTMKEVSRLEWPKLEKQVEKLKLEFKDDPKKLQNELTRLEERTRKPHGKTYYRDNTTGRTVQANWEYYEAKYANAPVQSKPDIPKELDHVAILPSGQWLNIELGNQLPDEGMLRVRVHASRTKSDSLRTPSMQLYFGWQASNEGRALLRVSQSDTPITASPGQPEVYVWDVPLGEIYPRNSVRTTSSMGEMPSPSEYIRLVNSSASPDDIQVDYVEVAGPVFDQWPPASHKNIFMESNDSTNESAYAKQVVSAFMLRAWRRPLTEAEIEQKLRLFHAFRPDCESFEEAVVEVLATVLSSPHFLYISQNRSDGTASSESEFESKKTPEDAQHLSTRISAAGTEATSQVTETANAVVPNQRPTITQHELATRLSLFLWCSVPDETLLSLATAGRLNDPQVLSDQVRRMMSDARSQRFAEQFVHQWLNMQLLDFLNISQHVPGFDPLLKEAMQYEPVALFNEVLRNDESVLNLLHSDYTMANERLAKHYGISGVYGNHFRRVKLDGDFSRGGLLTQAGLLAMNSSYPDSHPLKRGIWVLKSLLNDPPPPPPPAVPQIDLANPEIAKMTLKQRMEDHRNQAACMSCHAKIDPWGIAFENYDAIGRWRDQVDGRPVDATGELFNHQTLNGMDGLKRFLLENRQDQFVQAVVYKLVTFAMGRPLTFADRADIESITKEVRLRGDGMSTMVDSIVASQLFRTK